MTPGDVPEAFERDMGCTSAELLASLATALPGAVLLVNAERASASAVFDAGALHIHWSTLPPRRIALLVIPRTLVSFRYERMSPARRHEIQRRFDMVYQRGGG
ncbi:MAG: hypothetical protein HZC37_14170 [Burkholderiales bacterium]|nr:hypothetical protein [Burkholderiales bacterium]